MSQPAWAAWIETLRPKGSRLAPGGKYALLGTTMAPGFNPQDYEPGKRDALSAQYPNYAPLIAFLTR